MSDDIVFTVIFVAGFVALMALAIYLGWKEQ